ncbi:hypothetical protein SAMN04488057_10339 [Cyclobacterium lianum]|uniref:Uncharacterized protein n=1 Tax=Cyclobacterium lianum TaxID=388280 RepID=A0A1M7KZA9_9BACT|nr:hypothetical protein SAMN04488057_10339 [Cyclobacterium lianum]
MSVFIKPFDYRSSLSTEVSRKGLSSEAAINDPNHSRLNKVSLKRADNANALTIYSAEMTASAANLPEVMAALIDPFSRWSPAR